MRVTLLTLGIMGLAAFFLSQPANAAGGQVAEQATNIALGKSYTMQPAPNYSLCTDEGDKTQLTDGEKLSVTKSSTGPWVKKPMVGWKPRKPVSITVDLGSEQAISGICFRSAAGRGGISWPGLIAVFTALDNKNWEYVGDLRFLSDQRLLAPSDNGGYGRPVIHDFSVDSLRTSARYVRFVVAGSTYVFSDEVEIYAGDPAWVGERREKVVLKGDNAVELFVKGQQTRAGYEMRLLADRHQLDTKIDGSSLAPAEKKALRERLDNAYRKARVVELPSDSQFRAVIPFNEPHAEMHSIQGVLWNKKVGNKTVISKTHRYQWLSFGSQPTRQAKNALTISMLGNEFRSDALLLSNPSEQGREVKIEVAGIKGEAGWLRLFSVPWTDTIERILVATALEEVNPQDGTLTLPAGLTKRLWLMVDSSKLPPGLHSGKLILSDETGKQTVSFEVRVSSIAMQKPPVDIYMWDYVHANSPHKLKEEIFAPSVQLMRNYFVNTAWATLKVLPSVTADDFDQNDQLKSQLDFSALDRWMLEEWPDAKRYLVFLALSRRVESTPLFAGAPTGSEAFERRLSAWLKAITSRMEAIGVDPKKLALLPLDEPRSEAQFEVAAAWNKSLKKAAPRVSTYIDPITSSVASIPTHGALESADIISPNTLYYSRGSAADQKVYTDLVSNGKEFQFYLCHGPVRIADPTHYYRLHFWYALFKNATGIGYWSFADRGGAVSSWNEYTANGTSYSPVFLDDTSVVPSIHMEAMREGAEDYTLLAMLKAASERHPSSPQASKAQKIFKKATRVVKEAGITQAEGDQFQNGVWFQVDTAEAPDALRLEAIECLESFEKLGTH